MNSKSEVDNEVKECVDKVANKLHHTPAVCKKNYICKLYVVLLLPDTLLLLYLTGFVLIVSAPRRSALKGIVNISIFWFETKGKLPNGTLMNIEKSQK